MVSSQKINNFHLSQLFVVFQNFLQKIFYKWGVFFSAVNISEETKPNDCKLNHSSLPLTIQARVVIARDGLNFCTTYTDACKGPHSLLDRRDKFRFYHQRASTYANICICQKLTILLSARMGLHKFIKDKVEKCIIRFKKAPANLDEN